MSASDTSATRTDIMRRADALFDALLDLPDGERDAQIERLTDSPELRDRLRRLLGAHRRTGVLDRSPIAVEAPPAQLGSWRLGAEIGRGGMAVVYRAERDIGEGVQAAALKLLTVGALAAHGRERFLREQSLLARLDHPNIAGLLDAGILADGTPWLAMALVEGERIDIWCDTHNLHTRAIVRLFLAVCAAVAHAHRSLIVHRDLKPSNILVDRAGRVRLLDFGIARLVEESDTDSTATAMRVLTPRYAAPEQFGSAGTTTATDVFGLGAVLYALLAGRPPRDAGPDPDQTITAPSRAVRADVGLSAARRRSRVRAVYGDLDTIVLKALAAEPERRYPSVEEMAADLRAWLERRPIAARPGSPWYRTSRFVRRHVAGVAAAVVVAAVLVVATAHGFHQARQTRSALLQSETVRGFLVDLFESNAPSGARSDLPSTRDLLDRGAARARDEFTDSPELQADMLTTIGGIYRRLGLHAEARSLLRQALDVERRHDVVTDTAALDTRRELALLDLDEGHLTEAARELHDILDARRKMGSDTGFLVAAMKDVAMAESRLGHHAPAIALQREVLQMLSFRFSDPIEIAQAHNDLGAALMRDRQTAQAVEEYRAALGPLRAKLGPVHERVTQTQSNLASALRRLGRPAEAETLLRDTVAADERIYGGAHPDAAEHLNNLGAVLYVRDSAIEAEKVLTRAYAMYRTVLGDAHADTALAASNLALVQQRLGRYDDAISLQRAVLSVFEKTYGERHYSIAVAQNNLARSLVEIGALEEARELGLRSLALKSELRGAKDRSLAPALATIALVDEHERDYPAALRRYAQILQLSGLPDPAFDGGTLAHRVGRGRVLCRSGQAEQGLADFTFALSQAPLAAAEAPLKRANALIDEGDCLQSLGRIDAARGAWQQALALRTGRVPEDFVDNRHVLAKIDAVAVEGNR